MELRGAETRLKPLKLQRTPLSNGIADEIKKLCANSTILDPHHDDGKRLRMTEFPLEFPP